jgi:ABC-type branched-subunit amino acid transport system substrate-binding protein
MKRKGLAEGFVIAAFVLAAFLSGGTVGAKDVSIGVLYPFSGDLGIYGEPETDAMKRAVEEVNENGGVLGGKVLESVRYDPDRATFDSEVEKVAAVNPDFVMLRAYPETGSVILYLQ